MTEYPPDLDEAMREYLRLPLPTQTDLDALFVSVAGVTVHDGGALNGAPLGNRVLFESDDPRALRELHEALEVTGGSGMCLCLGDHALELRDRAGARLAVIAVHHGKRIRWNAWRADGDLRDPDGLLDWFMARGIRLGLDEERLRGLCIRRLEGRLGVRLTRMDRGVYSSDDRRMVVSLALSPSTDTDDSAPRTFALRGDQLAHLRSAERAWCAFMCGWPDAIALIPLERMIDEVGVEASLPPQDAGHFVLLEIASRDRRLSMRRLPNGEPSDISEYLIP